MVFVELPEVGRTVSADEEIAVVESVKAASDVYAPIAGEIVEINDELVIAQSLPTKTLMAKHGSLKSSLPM